jgi:bacteriocin-like protein
MNNEFSTIDTNDLDNVTGGAGAGQVIKKGAQWAWRNVIAPIGGGAAWQAASDWMSGGNRQPQQPQQPQQGQ